MYISKDRQTPLLFKELFPFGGKLDEENRWIKLSKLIPWQELEIIYRRYFSEGLGRPGKDSRLICGLLVVKHIEGYSDRRVIMELMESPYVQAFCGFENFITGKEVIDDSSLSKMRKRLGRDFFNLFETEVLKVLVKGKHIRPGEQMLDATVIPADISFPTDCKLIHRARLWVCDKIRTIRKRLNIREKVRTYARKAKSLYINFGKVRKKKIKFVRLTQKRLLQYLRRNIGQIENILKRYGAEIKRKEMEFIKKRIEIIRTIYNQQWEMWKEKTHQMKNRIVSLDKPNIRPMVRGKDGKDVEFGPKALLSWVDGYCFLDHFSFETYNEAEYAEESLKKYLERFGKWPKTVIGDGIFGNRNNRKLLKEMKIGNAFKPLGRVVVTKAKKAWLKRKQRKRNGRMEGIIGHAKSKFGLDRILYRIDGGEEIWTKMGLMSMNLMTALKKA